MGGGMHENFGLRTAIATHFLLLFCSQMGGVVCSLIIYRITGRSVAPGRASKAPMGRGRGLAVRAPMSQDARERAGRMPLSKMTTRYQVSASAAPSAKEPGYGRLYGERASMGKSFVRRSDPNE